MPDRRTIQNYIKYKIYNIQVYIIDSWKANYRNPHFGQKLDFNEILNVIIIYGYKFWPIFVILNTVFTLKMYCFMFILTS